MLQPCLTGGRALADARAGGGVPHLARPLPASPPGLLVSAAALTGLAAPHVSPPPRLTRLLLFLATPTLALRLVLHLQRGALLVTLAPGHRAAGQHDGHLPHPAHTRHAAGRGVTAPAAPPHHNMAGAQLVSVRVVGPGNRNHL